MTDRQIGGCQIYKTGACYTIAWQGKIVGKCDTRWDAIKAAKRFYWSMKRQPPGLGETKDPGGALEPSALGRPPVSGNRDGGKHGKAS